MSTVGAWTFLTNHARVLLFVAHNPGARLRDLADGLGITERTAFGIVSDLTEAGYVVKEKDGRRNRYQIQGHLSLREPITPKRTIGEMLDLPVEGDGSGAGGHAVRSHGAGRTQPDGPDRSGMLRGG